jgi:hypothetical protein
MGRVISKKVGTSKPSSFMVSTSGSPRVTTRSMSLRIRAVSKITVKANRPTTNGGRISAMRYLVKVRFTIASCYLVLLFL